MAALRSYAQGNDSAAGVQSKYGKLSGTVILGAKGREIRVWQPISPFKVE
jgi:hypothetical protein